MALNLSDGQLTTSSAQLVTLATASQYVAGSFFNTSATAEVTVTLTLTRLATGTARQIARAKLAPLESFYFRGLALDVADTLAGYATLTTTIDYLIALDTNDTDFFMFCRAADGSPKPSTTLTLEVPEKEEPDVGQVEMIELLKDMRDLLRRIA